MTAPLIDLGELERMHKEHASGVVTFERKDAEKGVALVTVWRALPALLAAVRAAIEQVESDNETIRATLSDDLNSLEAEAAFQRGHDANKALLATLAASARWRRTMQS